MERKGIPGKTRHITVLGAGPAGLAAGYYANKYNLPFTIFEATNSIGGNSRTCKYKGFLFDSGAHRFHDKNPDITTEVKKLLGRDLLKINIPSHIYYNGKLINFPLTPLNTMRNIGIGKFARVGLDLAQAKLTKGTIENFEDLAMQTYGKSIADTFLLNYSKKLWGADCANLSTSIAGKRLKGLNMKTILLEFLLGDKAKSEHIDGSFYYPKYGIGMIAAALEKNFNKKNIIRRSRITKVFHDGKKITEILIDKNGRKPVHFLASTIPLTNLITLLDPSPPKQILKTATALRFRDLKLVMLFINKKSITKSGTIYFPQSSIPFTRIYEPTNRSKYMSPEGKTSLGIEFPCQFGDEIDVLSKDELVELAVTNLIKTGWFNRDDLIDSYVEKISHAYPILEIGFAEKVDKLLKYSSRFKNLSTLGRGGNFEYSWIHNQMDQGKDVIETNFGPYVNTTI